MDILGNEILSLPMRIATVAAPVAVYFLILGLLNSRRHPQLLTGRQDFALLVVALSPLFLVPIVGYFGTSLLVAIGISFAVAAAVVVLGPRDRSWVIYNMPPRDASAKLADAFERAGLRTARHPSGLSLPEHDAIVQISGFSVLRNVTVRLQGGDGQTARMVESALSREVAGVCAQTSPMAVSLLLVATAMLVVPLTLVADRVPQIVRVLTDLLH